MSYCQKLQISFCSQGAGPSTQGSVGCSPLPLCYDRWTVTHKPALGRKEFALPAGPENESKENMLEYAGSTKVSLGQPSYTPCMHVLPNWTLCTSTPVCLCACEHVCASQKVILGLSKNEFIVILSYDSVWRLPHLVFAVRKGSHYGQHFTLQINTFTQPKRTQSREKA